MLFPHRRLLLFTTLIATAAARPNFSTLIKSRPELTNLSAYFDFHPEIVQSVLRWPNGTFLAPNDDAFANAKPVSAAFGAPFSIIDLNDTNIATLFEYHTLLPFVRSADLWNGPHTIPTSLVDLAHTSLSGGQVVVANGVQGQQPSLTSGLQRTSTIVVSDLEYEAGIVHIVDRFLTVPPSVLKVLGHLGLSAAEGALTKATNLGSELPQTNFTLFVPSNAAFEAVGSVVGNMSETQLHYLLSYHVVPDVIGYWASASHNVSLPTLISEDVHIVADSGKVFVNSAEAVVYNVLAAEGVIHIIDNVLNPNNTTAMPNYTVASQAPAFSGATPLPGGIVPFTRSFYRAAASDRALSTGAKAGIGIGAALALLFVVVCTIYLFLRQRRSRNVLRMTDFEPSPSDREIGAEIPVGVVDILPMRDVGAKPGLTEGTAGSRDRGWGLKENHTWLDRWFRYYIGHDV